VELRLTIASSQCISYDANMSTITIPKKLANKGDLIIIPRKEYESLLELHGYKEFVPTLG